MFVILLSSVALALEDPVKEDSDRFTIIIVTIIMFILIIVNIIFIFIMQQKPEVGSARLRLHGHLCD